jgi:hypothetical protein
MDTSNRSKTTRSSGCALAFFIGLFVIAAGNVAFMLITGMAISLSDGWPILLDQVLIAGAPYGLLALAGVRNRAPWIAGLTMTAALWGYYFIEGARNQLRGYTAGANIGPGLVMLASPVMISVICFAVHGAQRARS